MRTVGLGDVDILDVGNTIQLHCAIYSGLGRVYLAPMPDEDPSLLFRSEPLVLLMSASEWDAFLQQSDVQDIKGPNRAILRKSQRLVDQVVAWQVYERDGYCCRYCGRRLPLTVDHVDLWEDGGATVAENLVSACRRCNKLRGSVPYPLWVGGADYASVSANLSDAQRAANAGIALTMPRLVGMRRSRKRSR